MPQLVDPDVNYHAAFLHGWDDFLSAGEDAAHLMGAWSSRHRDQTREPLATASGFASLVRDLIADRSDPADGSSMVPHTLLWWVDGDQWLGRVSIRHELSPALWELGGHLGYSVPPSARRQGHATAILAAALPVAHQLGIEEALVTCDEDNDASRIVIEKHGGIFDDVRYGKLRYWIPTRPDGN